MIKKLFGMVMFAAVLLAGNSISAFAVDTESVEATSSNAMIAEHQAEIQQELDSIEETFGSGYSLKSESTKTVGKYELESRLYTKDTVASRAASHTVGGVSVHTWTDWTDKSNVIKVYLYAKFRYDGETAECIEDSCYAKAGWADGSPFRLNFEPYYKYRDGSTAKVTCSYTIYSGPVPDIAESIYVSCTRAGDVTLNDESHHY